MNTAYRADIDGLRAIAVMSVLFYHVGSAPFSGGYVGVDVFFVISGFLITSIIERELGAGTFSIRQFYIRRCRRILPALLVVIAFCLGAGLVLLEPVSLNELGRSIVATALFSSNVLFYLSAGYFDAPSELKPLLHTWSLAVEEQYYVCFPLLMLAIARFGRRRYAVWLGALWVASFVTGVVATRIDSTFAFFSFPTRAWELLLGSLLAVRIVPPLQHRGLRNGVAALGLALIAVSVVVPIPQPQFPGYAALLPTLGATVVIYAGLGGETWVGRMLSVRPLVGIGLISYSLYLWHWPLIVFTKRYVITGISDQGVVVLCCGALLAAVLSWRFIEQPFRGRGAVIGDQQLLVGSGVALGSTCLLGLVVVIAKGFPERLYQAEAFADWSKEQEHWGSCMGPKWIAKGQSPCTIGVDSKDPDFILWGDSHAQAMAPAVDLSARRHGAAGFVAAKVACPPLLHVERAERTTCENFNANVLSFIEGKPSAKTVILAGRWAFCVHGKGYGSDADKAIRLVDVLEPSVKSDNATLTRLGLVRTIRELQKLGRRVVVVGQVPEVAYQVPAASFAAELTGRDANQLIAPTVAAYKERTASVDAILGDLERDFGVKVVQPHEWLCNKTRCRVAAEDGPLYRDDDHLSVLGSRSLSRLFDPIFDSAVSANPLGAL